MNLKEFITTTLVEIAEGIKDAQPKYSELGGIINPSHLSAPHDGLYGFIGKTGSKEDINFHLSTIEFEVGLTDNSGSEGRTGLGVFFGSVGLGGSAKEQESMSSATKVKFSIPVKLPTQQLE